MNFGEEGSFEIVRIEVLPGIAEPAHHRNGPY